MPKNSAPDPYEVADAQRQATVGTISDAQQLLNYNETNPYGSVTYDYSGDSPTRTVALSPEQQQLYDQSVQLATSLNTLAQQRAGGDLSGQGVTDAILARLEPQFTADEQRWRTQLANQGLTPGSEAYNNELELLGKRVNDARIAAVLAGGQEQSRQIQDILNLGGAGVPATPQFQPGFQQGVQPPAVDQYIYNTYGLEQERRNNIMQGLFGLGGTFLQAAPALAKAGLFGLSDRRAKTDIKRIGKTDGGVPLYRYRYKGDPEPRVGPMAQDVRKIQPEAVAKLPSGLFAVNYGSLH